MYSTYLCVILLQICARGANLATPCTTPAGKARPCHWLSAQYREVLAQKLLEQGLIRDESQLKHRYTLSQTPTQAAFIERFNQTLRQKLRLVVQSELPWQLNDSVTRWTWTY